MTLILKLLPTVSVQLLVAVLTLLLMPWPAAASEPTLKKASLIPLWSPQAQFAGYYVALDKGIYRKHGIDLTVIPGGPAYSSAEYLRSGKADFALLWLTTALQEHAAGVDLVNIAQIVRKSSMLLVVRKESGIAAPADLNGRKVGLWGGEFAIPPQAFFEKYGLKVREVPQSYTVNLFLRGGIDAASAMWYNEYHTILNAGLDAGQLTTFFLHEHGLNLPEDGLYTLAETLDRDPDLAAGVAQASLDGWRYAFAHSDEALDIVIAHMRAAKLPANRMHQKWMLDRMRDLIIPGGNPKDLGSLPQADYDATRTILMKKPDIRVLPDYGDFVRRGR